jgi:hypothetical protein
VWSLTVSWRAAPPASGGAPRALLLGVLLGWPSYVAINVGGRADARDARATYTTNEAAMNAASAAKNHHRIDRTANA